MSERSEGESMAAGEVTGWDYPHLLERKKEFKEQPAANEWAFEEAFCLVEIGKQPEWYAGPQRFCGHYTLKNDDETERSPQCRMHGGWKYQGSPPRKLEEGNTEAMKHGMYAEDANLKKEFTEADEKLYDLIMGWAEEYGFDEDSPEYVLLEDLALSKVREMRSEVYLNENGEIVTRETFDPNTGERITEEDTHPLKNDLRLQKKTVLDMMKELGLTPKAKSHMDTEQAEAGAIEDIANIAGSALDGDDEAYDPERFDG